MQTCYPELIKKLKDQEHERFEHYSEQTEAGKVFHNAYLIALQDIQNEVENKTCGNAEKKKPITVSE